MSCAPTDLPTLEAAIRRDLALLTYPQREWVPARLVDGKPILDVLIVGAGQSGLATAFALLREKVTRILVVDEKPEGREGPWRDFARMITLRTPKYVTGPDLGIPNLTFQAWYEAQYGSSGWESLKLIPKELWADYLLWYRRTLHLPVRNGLKIGALEYRKDGDCWAAPALSAAGTETILARKVVLATGIDGSGQWEQPEVAQTLPKRFWAHTHEAIDFDALKGRRVGVLGAGASAFDNASVALEAGAGSVDLCFRRDKLVNVNPYRWAEFAGFLNHHADLDDERKWQFIVQFLKMGQLPPADTLARAQRHRGFSMHPGSPWTRVEAQGDEVRVTTPRQSFVFDFLIFGTGLTNDLRLRPEMTGIVEQIALWSDRFTPPSDQEFPALGNHPYLGPAGEFLPKSPQHSYLSSLFCFTFGGLPSLGFAGAFISGMKYSVTKLVHGITAQLYRDDAEQFFRSLQTYDAQEF